MEDDVGIDRVEFFVGESQLADDRTAPYSCRWDTRGVADGGHVLKAVAYDRAGRRRAQTRVVIVDHGRRTASPRAGPVWEEVAADDFDVRGRPDARMWRLYDGPGHNGNGLRRPAAAAVRNGRLVITAEMLDGSIVSGGLAHRRSYRYGRFEFRVRVDDDSNDAVSGVVLTWPKSENWPADGENDIFESGLGDYGFHSFVHAGPPDQAYGFTHPVDATGWHRMAMEWDPTAIRVYRDGVPVWAITDPSVIPDVRHRLCIQLDAVEPVMQGVVRMYVDDVRIYQRL